MEKSVTIVRSGIHDEDPGYIWPSIPYAQMCLTNALIESGDYNEALEILDGLEDNNKYTRRKAIIQADQARALVGMKEYEHAVGTAQYALDTAMDIKSAPNILLVKGVHKQLLQSPIANSVEVRRLGLTLQNARA